MEALKAILLVVLYFVPLIVVCVRRANNALQVAVVNVLLGWTVIGWVIALVMAVKPMKQRESA